MTAAPARRATTQSTPPRGEGGPAEASHAYGDVHWVELDPIRGSEIAKTRPCVIVSDSDLNARRRTVVIVPLTSTPQPAVWPLLLALPDFSETTKVRPDQIRTVDKGRVKRRVGALDVEDMARIGEALKLILRLR